MSLIPNHREMPEFVPGDIAAERESRMAFLRRPDDSVINRFHEAVLHLDDPVARHGLLRAWEYAQSLDYHHPGQSKAVYLAHPLRVTTLYMQLFQPVDEPGVMTAILHNVMEVTNVRSSELAPVVGREIAEAVLILTVDRERQWDDDYKRSYYFKIENSRGYVPRVKILDKLDNLFLLCLNPSEEIREKYLREIEAWLIPMAQRVAPQLAGYLSALVQDNRRVGHSPLHAVHNH